MIERIERRFGVIWTLVIFTLARGLRGVVLRIVFRLSGMALLAVWLSGCTQSGDALLDDYVNRVANVLDADRPARADLALPTYPRPRDIRQDPPEIRIDVLDAWSLRDCEVFTLLGERNSILGRVATPEIRLDYERRLLTLLPRCLNSDVVLKDELRSELEWVLAQKRRGFGLHVWNASLANSDYRSYWTGGNQTFAAVDTIDAGGYAAVQQRLAQLVSQPLDSDMERWLAVLKRTSEYPMGGLSLHSMRTAMTRLRQTEQMLVEAADDSRLCPMGPAVRELSYARNVMVGTFIGEVQPWLVSVDQRFLAGYNALASMHQDLAVESAAMADYVAELTVWHRAFRADIARQVEAWQRLFEVCGRNATTAG